MSRSSKTTTDVDEAARRERDAEEDRLVEIACRNPPPLTDEQRLILGPILRRWAVQYPPPAVPDEAA